MALYCAAIAAGGGDAGGNAVEHTLQPKFETRIDVEIRFLEDDTRQSRILAAEEDVLEISGEGCMPLCLGHSGPPPNLLGRRLVLREASDVGVHRAQDAADDVEIAP